MTVILARWCWWERWWKQHARCLIASFARPATGRSIQSGEAALKKHALCYRAGQIKFNMNLHTVVLKFIWQTHKTEVWCGACVNIETLPLLRTWLADILILPYLLRGCSCFQRLEDNTIKRKTLQLQLAESAGKIRFTCLRNNQSQVHEKS